MKLHTTCVPAKDFQMSLLSSSSSFDLLLLPETISKESGICMRSSVTWPPAPCKRLQPSACSGADCGIAWCCRCDQKMGGCCCFTETMACHPPPSASSCRASTAARFSAISSLSAALDRDEKSDVAIQGEALDDRRERAQPGEADRYGAMPPMIALSAHRYLSKFKNLGTAGC